MDALSNNSNFNTYFTIAVSIITMSNIQETEAKSQYCTNHTTIDYSIFMIILLIIAAALIKILYILLKWKRKGKHICTLIENNDNGSSSDSDNQDTFDFLD